MLATLTPQEAVDRGLPKPSPCDAVIVILWSRMGTRLPDVVPQAERRAVSFGHGVGIRGRDLRHSASAIVLVYRRRTKVVGDLDDADFEASARSTRS